MFHSVLVCDVQTCAINNNYQMKAFYPFPTLNYPPPPSLIPFTNLVTSLFRSTPHKFRRWELRPVNRASFGLVSYCEQFLSRNFIVISLAQGKCLDRGKVRE